MNEIPPEDEKLGSLYKNYFEQVSASSSFKNRLLSRLIEEGKSPGAKKPRKWWSKPLVWAPVAAGFLALVAFLVVFNLPVQEPDTETSVPPVVTNTGTLRILITDAPPQRSVAEINVLLSNVRISKNDTSDGSGWLTVFPGKKNFDLIKLRDMDLASLLEEVELETGKYAQIRFDVHIVDAVVDNLRISDGIKVPSGTLKMPASFEIKADRTTVLTIDFDAAKSLVFSGNGDIIFKPVVKITVAYE